MRSTKLCAFAACVCLNAGCGSSPSNFYDVPSSNPGAPSGGANGAAGSNAMSQSGSGSGESGGQSASGGGTVGMHVGNAPCGPVKDITGGASGAFGTTGAVCFRVTGDIAGWGCSNFDGRSLKVNGHAVTCAELPLPDKIEGAYYFDISAGALEYASFYWF